MQVAVPLFPEFTALDAIGPYEVLQRITRDATFEEVPSPEIVVFPGGVVTRPLMQHERVLEWVRTVHPTTRFTTSVCTGSTGAIPTADRVVEHLDRRIITAAGVSSGIDMALRLVELLFDDLAAKASQLMIEYDPQPPFDCGALAKVDDAVITRVVEYSQLRK